MLQSLAPSKILTLSLLPLLAILLAGCNGSSSSSEPEVTVPSNQVPIAIAGVNQQVKLGQKVQLDGSSSVDYDKELITYAWSWVDKPQSSEAALSAKDEVNPSFNADVIGTYLLQLIVNDGHSDSRPNQVKITVVPAAENSAPTVTLKPSHSAILHQYASISPKFNDIDGDELLYQWQVLSQPEGSQPYFTPNNTQWARLYTDTEGDYQVQVTVSDGLASTTATTMVTFYYENLPPTTYHPVRVYAIEGMTLPLDGSTASDPNGDPLSFEWFFVSKPDASNASIGNPNAVTTEFVADVPGVYFVNAEVSDGEFTVLAESGSGFKVFATDAPHTRLTRGDSNEPLPLPHQEKTTFDLSGDTGAIPEYYELGSYTFAAIGKDITITVSTISDANGLIPPIARTPYKQLTEGEFYVIPAGTEEKITLLSPPTSGQTTKPGFSFEWSLNGTGDYSMQERLYIDYVFTSR